MHTVQHLLLQIGDGTWQDVMLSAGNIFFCITFIPMLRQPDRPPLLTCIPTGEGPGIDVAYKKTGPAAARQRT